MDNNQQILVHLLAAAIRGENINNNRLNNINWNKIFKLAKEQDIYSMLYPVIKNIYDNWMPKNEIIFEWKKATILASLRQAQNINGLGSVLINFNKAKIQVVGLKGLVLRDFYPVKEFRTMSDSDLLVHIEDLDKARSIILGLGYFERVRGPKDIVFLHKSFLPIELHWQLLDKKRFKNTNYLEKSIWENTQEINIGGSVILTPSLENQILYLCLHMASHFMYSGFGLRQLCDLVVLVESQEDKINWNRFYENVKKYKIENFIKAIFEVCRRLFRMDIPKVLYDKDLENIKYIDMIIQNIFVGGVHGGIYGTVNWGPVYNNILYYYKSNKQSDNIVVKAKYMVGLLFLTSHKLPERYSYAKQHRMFLPIAWVHRLIRGIFRKDLYVDLKSLIFRSQSDFYKKRIELFKWLDL
ncbi:nucleotidyltransferase family protein [Clostridium kluyveri]|uniref:nucleotidyltransferase domain-containing protein n=1 Tax=Clostridium kluyveri TaxID=1534 RepID=UPI0022458234|nr:nucleotidyltransferase family protein [Clostridium kluyveri]UZQ50364.1 nucleotidyltransferase family protein [Clostridium kluyveri]